MNINNVLLDGLEWSRDRLTDLKTIPTKKLNRYIATQLKLDMIDDYFVDLSGDVHIKFQFLSYRSRGLPLRCSGYSKMFTVYFKGKAKK